MSIEKRIILLPGIADARMFEPLRSTLPRIVCPEWIAPHRRESLRSYAHRFADSLQLTPEHVIGGSSFGGFVALEMAGHVGAPTCLLIGSVPSPSELPPWIRWLRPAARLMAITPWELFTFATRVLATVFHSEPNSLARQFSDADPAFLRWGCEAMLTWQPDPATRHVYALHLHGEHDRVLPCRFTTPTERLPGAGHVPSMTHADAVAAFIERSLPDPV